MAHLDDAPYQVFVDDNFHAYDASARTWHGGFATCAEAVAASCRIVDDWLTAAYRPGLTAAALWEQYANFGDDPFVVVRGAAPCPFSAWTYARERCAALAGPAAGSPE